jgi:hypothetical protein
MARARIAQRVLASRCAAGHNVRVRLTSLLPWLAAVAVGLALPAWFWSGGSLEAEALTFLTNYTDDRSVLRQVFDPAANDFGTYQARELSYFLDWIDANVWLGALRAFDFVAFVPLSALLSTLATVLVFAAGVRRTLPALDRGAAGLLLLLYVSSFVFVSTMGMFYRSGKPWLAPALLALLFVLRRLHQRPVRRADPALVFAVALVIALLDRQGHFYVLAIAAMLGLSWLRGRTPRSLVVSVAGAAACAFVYDFVVGPLLIEALNGYWPRMNYQGIPKREIVHLPWHGVRAAHLLAENAAVLLGGFFVVGAVAWAALVAVAWRRRDVLPRGALHLALLGGVLQMMMFGLMIARHRYVYEWIDHRQWYYPLPFLATVLFALAVLGEPVWAALDRRARRIAVVAALLLVASNLASLEHHRQRMLGAPWFPRIHAQTPLLRQALETGTLPEGLDAHYSRFARHMLEQKER